MSAVLLSALLLLACGDEGPVPGAGAVVDGLGLAPPEAAAHSASLSAPPSRAGNTARLLTNGEAALAERLRLISEARRSIYVQALIFKADTSGRLLAEALIARKKEQPELDVRVIVDAYANIQDVTAQLLYFDLQNAGIEVEGYETFYLHWLNEVNLEDWLAGNKRFHEKYLVVDGDRAIVGGMNIADEYFRCSSDPVLTWRDQDLYLQGPVAGDVHAAFLDNLDWFKSVKQAKPELLNPDAYWELWGKRHPAVDLVVQKAQAARWAAADTVIGSPDGVCDGQPVPTQTWTDVPARFLRSRPREGERLIHEEYLRRVRAARSEVVIENAYFVPPPDLQQALVDAAKRGVAVTVITNSDVTNDIPMITKAGRARYLDLVDAGVQVGEWHAEIHGEGTIHAKLAVFDRQATLIGSYNLDPRSLGLNSEDVVVVEHEGLSAELAQWIDAHDRPMVQWVDRAQAVAWADPASLPAPEEKALPWDDPRFDPAAFEYWLLRRIEGSL